jgi:uncharacterized protein
VVPAGRGAAHTVGVRERLVRHEVVLYLAVAFALSWAFWPFVLLNPESSPLVPWGPLVAAVAVTALTRGRGGLTALARQVARWRVPGWWYLAAPD